MSATRSAIAASAPPVRKSPAPPRAGTRAALLAHQGHVSELGVDALTTSWPAP